MAYETILFEQADGVARLTLNRPDRLNAFTIQMHEEIADAIDHAVNGHSRALLMTGAGRGFCAGQDLSDRAVLPGNNVDLGASIEKFYNPLVRKLTGLDMPVICAVNGVAAGAGANIALACDIVIAARSAKFVESFANIGLIPDSGGTWVLPQLLGQARALGLALTGEPISAQRAESWGLIWKCVDDNELADEANSLASRLAQGPTLGLAATKQAIRQSAFMTLAAALDRERDLMRTLGRSADYQEGVTAFLAKRQPVFHGR
jgi:2-(1,2-epoxy-1,2-dihydrophenyl)acetyl-CoA isomerase